MLRAGRWFTILVPLVTLLMPEDAAAARPLQLLRRARAEQAARVPSPTTSGDRAPPPPPAASAALASAAKASAARPRLFLSCPSECFADYLRQELSYFDVVRDPHLDNVLTLLVVRQPSANGGERFSVTPHWTSLSGPASPLLTRSFVGAPGATEHALRQELLQLVLRALHVELASSAHESAFELRLRPRDAESLDHVLDPWDFWVFAPELSGNTEGESGRYFAQLKSSLNLWRITETNKLRFSAKHTLSLNGFRLEDGSRVRGVNSEWQLRALHALSLGEHWALGSVAEVAGSDYENLDLHIHYGPLVEFNIFPYADNASQQLRFAYQLGTWVNWYGEPNQQGKLRELHAYHALSVIADVNQPWGSWQWVGQLNSFLARPEQYRLSTGITLALRLVEGLALTLTGEAAVVRDLINLRGRNITDRELLLDTAQLPTSYTTMLELGITYTFGSVHNTIVNPRFGRVDLQED
ncbi:MAG: hypothetical protein RL033_7397 [Pseudomonadota bacterium]|jgi:hypothetical protein